MDIHSNFEYVCRVCAGNTKGKNSVAECVYILKTAGLKDKLDKFLYLKISENDSFPKVLCKSCFRQVEATASLSQIAQNTQRIFRDFLLSSLPKGSFDITNSSEFTSTDFIAKKDSNEKSKNDANTTSTLMPAPPLQPLTAATRKDEVVVNVSVADPLTRDNQQKMISNSQRRQSLLLDSRYTPKSIAQKSSTASVGGASALKLIAPKTNQTMETANTTNSIKTTSTPSLNFYPVKPQQSQQQTTQITTFTSGGYVIGRINNEKQDPKLMAAPLAAAADNVLQQKRKNLVRALNNIKANNSGQVSLLKSSQLKQNASPQASAKTPLTEVVNQATEDELPDKIIIAAPKMKGSNDKSKKEPLNLSSKITTVPTGSITQATVVSTAPTIATVPQPQPSILNNTPPKPGFPEDILLGRVIRDMDLLKLILKALKWPLSKQNMELQLQRLKNSKFTDIMSDPNLLQDTDLTQLLGPYLAPVLLAAHSLQQQQHQQQQEQLLKNVTLNQNIAASYVAPEKVSVLEAAYRLPPETSVQLVPATPEEQEPNPSPPLATLTNRNSLLKRDRQTEAQTVAAPQKRQRRAAAQRARDSIIISDEGDSTEEEAPKKTRKRSTKSTTNAKKDLNTNLMSPFNLLAGSGGIEANEALFALLQRQKAAIMKDKKVQRRRRNSISNLVTLPPNEFDALIDLDDDIVLVEPVSTTSSSSENVSATFSQEQVMQRPIIPNTFAMPAVPLITRPIIKRRKTVIHSSRGRLDMADKAQPATLTLSLASKEKLLEETINEVATGKVAAKPDNNITQQILAKAAANENSLLITSATKPAAQQKKLQSKSTLGQQLLEAIGLQKTQTKATGNVQSEADNTTSAVPNDVTVLPKSKQPIQQIRSALKNSLKQAQEKQQQRKKELMANNNTIIQDADSTTKTSLKEIVVVEGKANKTETDSSMVDVEDQIDKVTLMVRKNDSNNTGEQPTEAANPEENKEGKKPTITKIQERRRLMPALEKAKEKVQEEQLDEEETIENTEAAEENIKLEKKDSENFNISSSVAVSDSPNETTAATKDEVVATPKRRGRKRLIDKQNETEVAESNEKEKDDKTPAVLTERSRTFDKTKEEEAEITSNTKPEEETESNKTSSGRPARQSKTQSKYYKGPDKVQQSRRSLPSRTTRNRKYS